ncbi:MAG: PIN domain-containing protein [Bacteroidia bacterium]|jgi:predicted nucleic acid-binding protein|nr:PIN domain-containing protein [Bacteroidia bacterium]
MNDKIFLDTNILVYSYSYAEVEKQKIARELISENNSQISTQVLQELANTLIKKFKVSNTDVVNCLAECKNNTQVYINSEITIYKACEISAQYGFSFYDSLIIASALECDCAILYSEDLNDGQVIEGRLKIVNPFV